MARHKRSAGRHRALKPPSNRTPSLLSAAVVGTGLLGADHPSPDRAAMLALSQSTHLSDTGGANARVVPAEAPMPGHKLLSTAAAQNRLSEQRASRAAERAAELARPKWVRPGTGYLSSCFCARWGTFHYGIDLAASYGAPIYAAGDGVVIKAGPASGFGKWVVIEHADGYVTVYGHMEKFLVTVGERVQAGQLIALVGAEGESTGPHLHFEVHANGLDGRRVDPIPWLAARGVVI